MRSYTTWLALAAAVAALAGAALAHPPALTAVDQEQPRLDVAAPLPGEVGGLTQTFRAAHNGLSAVEVLAVVHDGAGPAEVSLSLLDAAGSVVAAQAWRAAEHNQALRLSFAPLPHSAGQAFTLALIGPTDGRATVWAYSLDGYAAGELRTGGQPAAGDLRFTATYTYLWTEAVRDAARVWLRLLPLAPGLWLALFAPGLLLLRALAPRAWAQWPWARWATALGLSLAVGALAWLWLGVLGLRWGRAGVLAAYVLMAAALIALEVRRRGKAQAETQGAPVAEWRGPWPWLRAHAHDLAMAGILFAALTSRLLAVRDLALPAWVDSPHHYTVARLLAEHGRVPGSYAPLLPVEVFYYHFGFHALAVTVQWLSPAALDEVLLVVGQVLNGLMPLAVYGLAAALTRRRTAALAAAFVVAAVSYFPGYYVTWGRYSQLAGLLVFAPAAAALWALVSGERLAGGVNWRAAGLAGALAAGVLLAHYRVFAFYVVFGLAALVVGLAGRTARPPQLKALFVAGGVGALLAAPWLARLAYQALGPLAAQPAALEAAADYNRFPVEYFQAGLERGWLALAGLAAAWGLARRERGLWALSVWTAAVFAGLNLAPSTWLVNNNTWAITLFVPAAVALGWGAGTWLEAAHRLACAAWQPVGMGGRWRAARAGAGLAMTAGLAGLAGYGAALGLHTQVGVVNPVTVLATADDRAALVWARDNLPADAYVLVNGWDWLNSVWSGPDGGVWMWALAGRRSTMPPNDYAYSAEWFQAINALNAQAVQAAEAGQAARLEFLRDAGVTHIFIGARGGAWRPEMFAGQPGYRLLFTNGAAWLFAVGDTP